MTGCLCRWSGRGRRLPSKGSREYLADFIRAWGERRGEQSKAKGDGA